MSSNLHSTETAEALLREALHALNEARCFHVSRLDCSSYDIASRIDAYFRTKGGQKQPRDD